MKNLKFAFIILVIFLTSQGMLAQGNLLVTPVRVVLEDGKTREDLNISNIGRDTAVYMISFLHYAMLPDGRFRELAKNDTSKTFADEYIRIFPRKVVLPPNESQVIRLQYRKPANVKPGEMRSHLYFRAEKEKAPLGFKDKNIDSTKMSVRLTPIFGISIPVIIRNGSLKLNVKLGDVSFKSINDSVARLDLNIYREGDKSVYGNILVNYISDKEKPLEIGKTNGVGVYTEINKRSFSMQVKTKAIQKQKTGKLVIHYVSASDTEKLEYASIEYKLQ